MPWVSREFLDHLQHQIKDLQEERSMLQQRLLDGPPNPEPMKASASQQIEVISDSKPQQYSTPIDRIIQRASKASKADILKFRVSI
jgi:hypothetical protein